MTDVRDFTDEELERINQKRRKGGLRQLSKQDARRARETHEAGDDGSDLMTFMLLFTDYDRGSNSEPSPAGTHQTQAEPDYQSHNSPAYDGGCGGSD